MFFDYCILLKRSAEEFWESRPSQIIFCIEKYEEMINRNSQNTEEVTEITSMHDIAGWGDKV